MIILDYGYPGIDSWWTRMIWTGTHISWVQGLADHSLREAGIVRKSQITSDAHMMHILSTSKAVTACPATFVGNQGLMNAWNESRTRV